MSAQQLCTEHKPWVEIMQQLRLHCLEAIFLKVLFKLHNTILCSSSLYMIYEHSSEHSNELLYNKVCIYDLAISICEIEISYYNHSLQQPDMNNDR